MLQNLQQKLVAQQQQQQQRQLHELLLQLLAVHKLGSGDNISSPLTVGQQESPLHIRRHGMCNFSLYRCREHPGVHFKNSVVGQWRRAKFRLLSRIFLE